MLIFSTFLSGTPIDVCYEVVNNKIKISDVITTDNNPRHITRTNELIEDLVEFMKGKVTYARPDQTITSPS